VSILSTHLSVHAGAEWGLIGGLCVEASWLYSRIRGSHRGSNLFPWRKPIPEGRMAYLVSVIVRVGLGAGLAGAAAGVGQVSGSFAAFGLGVAAPLVLEKLAKTVPLTGSLSNVQENRQAPSRASFLRSSRRDYGGGRCELTQRPVASSGPWHEPLRKHLFAQAWDCVTIVLLGASSALWLDRTLLTICLNTTPIWRKNSITDTRLFAQSSIGCTGFRSPARLADGSLGPPAPSYSSYSDESLCWSGVSGCVQQAAPRM